MFLRLMVRWWRRRWAWCQWRWSQDDAPDPMDAILLHATVKLLGDRPRAFIQQHCGLTLMPGLAGQDNILLILSDTETAFDEPYGQPDLYDILKTFWVAHRIGVVVVQEPGKTMLAMRLEKDWMLFRRR